MRLSTDTTRTAGSARGSLSIRRYLARRTTLLLLGTCLALIAGSLALFIGPLLQDLARARTDQVALQAGSHLRHLSRDGQRLLEATAAWVQDTDLGLDHRTLNRRFMPLLARFPEYRALRVIDPSGNEWMLFRKTDGTWLNRLSSPGDRDGTRRFLHWSRDGVLERDERLADDYDPLGTPWLKDALEQPAGQTAWSDIRRVAATGEPGISAVRRITTAEGHDLVLALDLGLAGIVHHLDPRPLGAHGLALLLNRDGRILGLAGEATGEIRNELLFQPVIGKRIGPLQAGLQLWLGRGEHPVSDHAVLFDHIPWQAGFRRLDLGGREIWLGVFLPWSGLLPGPQRGLAILGLVLLAALVIAWLSSRRQAAALTRPLEQIAADCRRLSEGDLPPPPAPASRLREVQELERTRDLLCIRLNPGGGQHAP